MPVSLAVGDGVAILTLDRPDRRNALDGAMWEALREHCLALAPEVRALVVTGAGGHFSSGMDLSADNPLLARVAPAIQQGRESAGLEVIRELKTCVAALAEVEVPTFAAIEGACVGGGFEVALACDVRIAATDASIGLTETRMGMIPDLGGCVRLTRLVGTGRAADLITTARRISGEEAFRLGMVERTAAQGRALDIALEAAKAVACNAPEAVRLALSVVRTTRDLGTDEALAVESRAGAMALASGEAAEGVAAFFERRPPRW
jgi:enoyl-CoA hydratase/carnithine racemase